MSNVGCRFLWEVGLLKTRAAIEERFMNLIKYGCYSLWYLICIHASAFEFVDEWCTGNLSFVLLEAGTSDKGASGNEIPTVSFVMGGVAFKNQAGIQIHCLWFIDDDLFSTLHSVGVNVQLRTLRSARWRYQTTNCIKVKASRLKLHDHLKLISGLLPVLFEHATEGSDVF